MNEKVQTIWLELPRTHSKNIVGGIYHQWNKPDADDDNILGQIQQAASSKKPLLILVDAILICFIGRIKITDRKMWQTSGEAPLQKVN